jgi:hypothetical protein
MGQKRESYRWSNEPAHSGNEDSRCSPSVLVVNATCKPGLVQIPRIQRIRTELRAVAVLTACAGTDVPTAPTTPGAMGPLQSKVSGRQEFIQRGLSSAAQARSRSVTVWVEPGLIAPPRTPPDEGLPERA